MKKFELEDKLIEQQQSTNIIERLTMHLDKLWEEITHKHTKIEDLKWKNQQLVNENKKIVAKCKELISEKHSKDIDRAEVERDLNDFLQIRNDN